MSSAQTSFTTADLAKHVSGDLHGRPDLPIAGVNALTEATAREITFITDAVHARQWAEARAGAAVISAGLEPAGHDPESRALIVVPNAALAVVELLRLFAPPTPQLDPGRHPSAFVHPGATIGNDVRIGPHVSIDDQATIGDRAVLHAGVRVYAHTAIGDDSILHANVVVRERCRLGRRLLLHPNVTIGADGFGYEPAPDDSGLVKVPHIGTVIIEDDVEIGAGSCVDRAKFGAAVIGAGTKIDNIVQIAHNCRIGRNCVIAALSGLSGSVTVGDGARIAGAVGIVDHISIGSGATIGAAAGVMKDVPPGETHLGVPAIEIHQTLRQWAAVRKLPDWMQQASQLLKVRQHGK
ncbi:MAG: UDP-3-O-(3-hydroxymyristoyl)glucosamine N-acyltransferase [Planctomycetota bacterium]|jgi:UDP-3-O-[3-hydroxymyristoyl] glucosamine N-acyltransferase